MDLICVKIRIIRLLISLSISNKRPFVLVKNTTVFVMYLHLNSPVRHIVRNAFKDSMS